MALQINIKTINPATTVVLMLDGELDALTASDLEKTIADSLTEDVSTLILNLKNLTFISSAGLRVFLQAERKMKSRGGKVYFTNLQPQVKKVFDIVKAVPLANVFQNIEELDSYLKSVQYKTRENNS